MPDRPTTGRPALAAGASLLAIFLGLCCQTGLAQNGNNGVWYLYPPEGGLTLHSLDTVNVSYISPFDSPNMFTFCDSGKNLVRVQPAAPKNGSVLVYLNFTSSTPCYFNLRPGMEAGFSANSPKFNLSSTPRAVMTTVGVSSSPTSSSSSGSGSETSTSVTAGTQTPSPSSPGREGASDGAKDGGGGGGGAAQPADSSSEPLSAGAKAGIGIGAALGGIGLLAAAFFFGRRRRGRGKAAQVAEAPARETAFEVSAKGYSDYGTPSSAYMTDRSPPPPELEVTPTEMYATSPPAEMPGDTPPVEMPTAYGHRPQY